MREGINIRVWSGVVLFCLHARERTNERTNERTDGRAGGRAGGQAG